MRFLLLLSTVILTLNMCATGRSAQLGPQEFEKLSGKYVEIVTDLPPTEEIKELVQVFDAAVPQWCELFDVDLSKVKNWRATAYVMLARERFETAGLIPSHLPKFPFGFQYGNEFWLVEQPSAYYRRHLFLHEGTHWFMSRLYGGNGPPWLMEGMAEWLGTHSWKDGELQLGIIPDTKESVPYWGRLKLIREQLREGIAPSLESILDYDSTAHRFVDAYAWSWAAVVFLKHHPETEKIFQAMMRRPIANQKELNDWLKKRLRSRLPRLRQEWSAFASELDYGHDPTFITMNMQPQIKFLDGKATVEIKADQSWQSSKYVVKAGEELKIIAEGMYTVGNEPAPWRSTADGLTLEYYRGQPIGKLQVAMASPVKERPSNTEPLEVRTIGSKAIIKVPELAEVFFRVNEQNGGLADNSGTLQITIEKIK